MRIIEIVMINDYDMVFVRYDRLRLVRTPVGLVGAIKEAVIKHW